MTIKQNSVYNKTILDSGLRIVTEKIPGVRSTAIGIWIDVGSRDETSDKNGITHFIEHMLFKGTRSRSAQAIALSLEALGGSLNAYTSREQTCFHALVLDKHLDLAVDVLSDILMNSTITSLNIKREKSVVAEEIREVNETPSDRIHELFSDHFWRGQPLGWPIMGTEENVLTFSRPVIRKYMNDNYLAGRIVIAAAGNILHQKLVGLVNEKLHFPPGNDSHCLPAKYPEGFSSQFVKNGSTQTHICVGFPGVDYSAPQRLPMLALNNYLGGGMSSVLFQKIREDRGMAYTVFTFPDFYRDCGVFGAYLATDRKHLHEAVETMLKEFRKVKRSRLPNEKIEMIKDQLKGGLILGMESTSSRMNRLGRQETVTGRYIPIKEALRAINKLTANNIIEAARKILVPDNIAVTALGSASEKDLSKVDWSLL
ncbi:MAG: peptidase M16 [candidate division Zixibacteria bacterium HGW-Zixibacteria-1]|nr:MAG: peptidase M16 [candidate division Zixibacteria bacterium HGW-Zixibacteria-1]